MPDDSPVTGAEIEELEGLSELTKTRGWKHFRNLLYKHSAYCLDNAHKCLAKHEDREAGEWLARSKEKDRAITLIDKRKKEISDKRERNNR